MATVPSDFAGLLTATANRLRLLQVDFADQNDEVRKQYLSDEMNRALAKVVPDQRREFLEQLSERFPTWDRQVEVPTADTSAAAAGRSVMDAEELRDAGFLVARLLDVLPTLSEAARLSVGERLQAAGVFPPQSGGWSQQAAVPVRAKLQLQAQQPLDANRVLELMDMLLDYAINLDQLVWGTWRSVAGDHRIKRPAPLLRILRLFMLGDPNVPRANLAQDVAGLRQLNAAMINATGEVARKFATGRWEKMAPAEIEQSVKAEGVPVWANLKALCWQSYQLYAEAMDAAGIEKEINEAITDSVERLTKGLFR